MGVLIVCYSLSLLGVAVSSASYAAPQMLSEWDLPWTNRWERPCFFGANTIVFVGGYYFDGPDQLVKWDTLTGKACLIKKARNGLMWTVALSSDGQTFATMESGQGNLQFRDASSGSILFLLDLRGSIHTSAFSANARFFAIGGDREVVVWDLFSRKVCARLRGFKSDIYELVFSPDSNTLAVADLHEVSLWELRTGQERRRFEAFSQSDKKEDLVLAFSPDGKTLATGHRASHDPCVKLWAIPSCRHLATLRGHDDSITSVVFARKGRLLISCGGAKVVIWDVSSETPLVVLDDDNRFAAVSSNSTVLATSGGKQVKIWSISEQSIPSPLPIAPKQDRMQLRMLRNEPSELEKLIEQLGSHYASLATGALDLLLRSDPGETIPLLEHRLETFPTLHLKEVPQLITDLDDDQFFVRDRATNKLEQFGDQARGPLEVALTRAPSLEARRRIERLLADVERNIRCPNHRMMWRSIEFLEYVGNSDSQRLLRRIARGDFGTLWMGEASASLRRLSQRGDEKTSTPP